MCVCACVLPSTLHSSPPITAAPRSASTCCLCTLCSTSSGCVLPCACVRTCVRVRARGCWRAPRERFKAGSDLCLSSPVFLPPAPPPTASLLACVSSVAPFDADSPAHERACARFEHEGRVAGGGRRTGTASESTSAGLPCARVGVAHARLSAR